MALRRESSESSAGEGATEGEVKEAIIEDRASSKEATVLTAGGGEAPGGTWSGKAEEEKYESRVL